MKNAIRPHFLVVLFLLAIGFNTEAQVLKKKMHRNICSSIDDEVAPYVSANGRAVVFLLRDSYSGKWLLEYATKKPGGWNRSVPVDPVNKWANTNYLGGHCLSADGNTLYFTSRKYGGVGQSDIWYTTRTSTGEWNTPQNLSKPVNSTQHDANPCVSADGKYLYFMRCASLDSKSSECCKIMVAERKGKSGWSEPVELPKPINTGCESSPRIAADNMTLYFASGRAGGKGGLDIYMSKKNGNSWSEPVACDFVNTEKDDQFISISSQAKFMYFHTKEDETKDMYKVIIPEEFQPHHVVQVQGRALHKMTSKPLKSIVRAYDLETGELVAQEMTNAKGHFYLFLPVGKKYDLAVNPLDKKHIFFSSVIDAKEFTGFKRQKYDVHLHGGLTGDLTPIHNLSVDENGALTPEGEMDMKRLLGVLKKTPNHHYELLIFEVPDAPEIDMNVEMDTTGAVTPSEVGSVLPPEPEEPALVKAIKAYLEAKNVPDGKIHVEWKADDTEKVKPAYEGEEFPKQGVVLHVLRGA